MATRTAETDRTVPGPAGLPFLGSMFDMRRDTLGTFLAAQREHGDVVRIWAGPPGLRAEVYAVFSAEGVQKVLATDSANFRKDNVFYEELRESFGNGLLTAQDEDYLRQRRLVQPLFTRRRVDGYAAAVVAETERMTAGWGEEVELVGEMTRFTLRAVARILFGTDVDAAVQVVEESFPVIGDYVLRRGYAPVSLPRTWPTPDNRRAAAATARLYAVCDRIIEQRRAAGAGPAEGPEADLLGLLAAAESAEDGSFDAAELRDQVLIFLLAGHETTATSLAFALHLLARHPEEQARAREEVRRVLGDRAPGAADLEALPYLTQVLKEAMRLYPAAPVIGRRAVAAAEIDGQLIPAGADVLLVPWVTHRHPRYWGEDPERFDPARFEPAAEKARARYAWFPFGGGPRACIGQHFSMLESVLALALLLRDFDFESLTEEVPVSTAITLQAEGAARVRVGRV
ncbi:cytochrome P450 [Streptomyces sp. NPDC089919]|uniref:cytochrome P450 n=1 Tax=Streptomyces sp. NPDC089919 TaxID=3155188 RepID=UPI00342C8DA1